ncbi:septal ring lytic transglycosylase RlpA family protein [Azorhizobium caulinodans]|nr:septal ring lytic transglycosylase RlpA family protein [Azorhizobium caulinodans]
MTRETQIVSFVRASRGTVGVAVLCLSLAACSSAGKLASQIDPKYGVSASPKVVADGQPVPKGGGTYRVGKPYVIAGRTYVPQENPDYKAEGVASWYGDDFHGRLTANGEVFDRTSISAAHPTLPMPSYVRVTNIQNGRSIIVRINDRGPYHQNRVIDVSHRTADLLGFSSKGVARVKVEYVGRAPLDGSDDRKLVATLRDDGYPAQVPANSAVQVASAAPFVPEIAPVMPRTASSEIPVPLQRPFDLGHADAGDQVADAQPAAPTRRTASVSSDAISAQLAKADVTAPARSGTVAPKVASAANASQAIHSATGGSAPTGWNVGPAPVSGLSYSGVTSSR